MTHQPTTHVLALDMGIKNFALGWVEFTDIVERASGPSIPPAQPTSLTAETISWNVRRMNNINLEEFCETHRHALRDRITNHNLERAKGSLGTGMITQTLSGIPWAIYRSVIMVLDEWKEDLKGLRPVVLIEQQMSGKHKANIKSLRLSQHVLSYFLNRHPSLTVVEFSSRIKTEGVKFGSYSERKKWAVERVMRGFDHENDPVAKDWLMQWKKKDDVADCILMCLSYYSLQHKMDIGKFFEGRG